jgi:hypothetical protein
VFFALAGVEELTDTAIIGEGYARSVHLASVIRDQRTPNV